MIRRWTLRRRLTLVVGLVILLVSAFIAVTVSAATRRTLIDRVDADLRVFAGRDAVSPVRPNTPNPEADAFEPFALIRLDVDGTVIAERPAGYADDPNPLPDVSGLALAELGSDSFLTLDTIGGDGSARVLIREIPQGYQVVATSLESVDSTTRQTLWTPSWESPQPGCRCGEGSVPSTP